MSTIFIYQVFLLFTQQGYGKSLWLMHGMFRANGGCGYVKKPEFLMQKGPRNEVFDPKRTLPVKKTLKVSLKCFYLRRVFNLYDDNPIIFFFFF